MKASTRCLGARVPDPAWVSVWVGEMCFPEVTSKVRPRARSQGAQVEGGQAEYGGVQGGQKGERGQLCSSQVLEVGVN